jgi:hypothetical protein
MSCMYWLHPTSAESLGVSAAGVVVYSFVEGGVHLAQTSPLHLHSLPVTFGLSAFVYSGHAVFPSIYRSMKDRSQYPRMLDTTYAIVGITGAFMGEPTCVTASCRVKCCSHCRQMNALCMQCKFYSDQLSGCHFGSHLHDCMAKQQTRCSSYMSTTRTEARKLCIHVLHLVCCLAMQP